ncbi:MAG TPA: molybdate ABC transporter permease subunit [Acidobacteriota bacterium]|nr:molybdate ABC transporter permease subunit [Acidobacteriota bacterium]
MNWTAIALTLKLATLTSAILLVLGLPIAYWITSSRWRWKFLVEAVVALPLVLPPTVLGFYILVAIGPNAFPGRLYERIIGHRLPFTFEGLLIASTLYSLPFAVQPFVAALGAVDTKLIEASWTLGVSRIGTFFRVILPQSGYGVLTGVILSFAHTLGEFGVVLMVGGDIEGITRTISIDIYDSVQSLDYASASRTSLVLLTFSFVVLSIVYALNRRIWAAGPEFRR